MARLGASAPRRLRALLTNRPGIHLMPCCGDALGAKLIEQAGFDLTFVSGFSASAAQGLPDTGLLSYEEMAAAMRRVCGALDRIPCIGDGDTGYGNAVNAKRTVRGYAAAGLAGVMIEDQVAPKRCGHTRDKQVVDFDTAVARVRAAVDASRELGDDGLLILARTDARATHGMEEAIERCKAFREAGAEMTFLEAPRSVQEMEAYCAEVDGWKLANCLAGGLTPALPPRQLEAMGYTLAAYPLDLLNASIVGMRRALESLKESGAPPDELTLPFEELQEVVGFHDYYEEEQKYRT